MLSCVLYLMFLLKTIEAYPWMMLSLLGLQVILIDIIVRFRFCFNLQKIYKRYRLVYSDDHDFLTYFVAIFFIAQEGLSVNYMPLYRSIVFSNSMLETIDNCIHPFCNMCIANNTISMILSLEQIRS